ncbi:MAG: CCA tRNA nucleotidyltransferase, partial [Candidatus Hydrogenedentes bacterium]|nr:CCA tRNA nucleotidyltransferase [Candidatus Hydrogenedentota bacterium]
LSNDDVQRITWLVKNHMRLRNFLNMRKHRRIRLARLEGFDELLALCRMDALASHGDSSFIDDIEEYLTELEKETLRPKPLVTGKDLIEMGYTPGPEFKRILETIETLQLEGQLIDTATAKAYTVNHFSLNELSK